MEILLIDGILDGTILEVDEPLYNTILGYSKNGDSFDTCTYYQWNEEIHIAQGNLNNVERILVKMELERDKDDNLIMPRYEELFDEANKLVREKYKNNKVRLVDYKTRADTKYGHNKRTDYVIAKFDYYIYR